MNPCPCGSGKNTKNVVELNWSNIQIEHPTMDSYQLSLWHPLSSVKVS